MWTACLTLCPSRNAAAALGGRSARHLSPVLFEFARRLTTRSFIFILFHISNVASWFQGLLVLGEPDGWPGPLVCR